MKSVEKEGLTEPLTELNLFYFSENEKNIIIIWPSCLEKHSMTQ